MNENFEDKTIHKYQDIECVYQGGKIYFLMEYDNPDKKNLETLIIGDISVPEHLSPYDFVTCCEAWIDAALELDKISDEDASAVAKTLAGYEDGEIS